jgi:small GTP-binding protein
MSDDGILRLIEKAELSGWEELNLSDRDLTELPAEIGRLKRLISLDLSGNQLQSLPDEIGRLTNLQSLNLGPSRTAGQAQTVKASAGNHLKQLPDAVGNLSALRFLILKGNRLESLGGFIGRFNDLQLLDISHNHLTALPKEFTQLKTLVTLHANNNAITELPARFERLEKLTTLELGNNQLTALPDGIGELTRLRVFDVGNSLTLNRSGEDRRAARNQLRELPATLSQLKQLAQLFAQNNQIGRLPQQLLNLRGLRRLDLRGNPLPIPPEILSKAYLPHAIINYYEDALNAPPEMQLNEAHVVVIGPQNAGKSALIEHLISGRSASDKPLPTGLNVRRWQVKTGEQTVRVNVWDGDPGLLETPHQFWRTQRTVYLLVTDATIDEADNHLETWLRLIRTFGKNTPVVIAHNKSDIGRFSLVDTALRDKFKQVAAVQPVSAQTGDGIEPLRDAISVTVTSLKHVDDLIPRAWYQLKLQLESSSDMVLTFTDYQQLCTTQEIADEYTQRTLLQFLDDIDVVVLLYSRKTQDVTHVIKREWLVEAIYRILHAKTAGRFAPDRLQDWLAEDTHSAETHTIILQAMQQLQLGYFSGDQFIIPSALTARQPAQWQPDNPVVFQYGFSILPYSLVAGAIVKLRNFVEPDLIWRDGALLAFEDSRALIKADSAEKTITIAINGSTESARQLLSLVRTHFDALDHGLPGLTIQRRVLLPPDDTISENFDHLVTLEQMGVRSFVPEGSQNTFDVTATLNRIVSPELRNFAPGQAESTQPSQLTWESESAEKQLIRMRRINRLVNNYATEQTRHKLLQYVGLWLIAYLLILQLDFLGVARHIIGLLIAAGIYIALARQLSTWLPHKMVSRLTEQKRFETLVEIDFDDDLYRRLEDEHGFHETFLE